jgi:hypothetical protein
MSKVIRFEGWLQKCKPDLSGNRRSGTERKIVATFSSNVIVAVNFIVVETPASPCSRRRCGTHGERCRFPMASGSQKMASRIVGTVDLASYDFRQDIQYLNSVEKQPEEYDEFAQGYWKNLSLLNSSGCMDDSQYKNCASARATGHMVCCPEIARMLEETFNLEIVKMVRARNLMDGMVIPHRDFVELDPELSYFRVFLPIEYNEESYHSDVGGVFQMRPGEVWFLDAAVSHAAINFSSDSRMFICLDFVFNGEFNEKAIFRKGALVPGRTRDIHISRPALSEDDLTSSARSLPGYPGTISRSTSSSAPGFISDTTFTSPRAMTG